jgi:hypothetical protein
VASLLLVSAATTGALAGFALGVVWIVLRLPALPPSWAAVAVGAALAADLGPRPLSVGRQVPREWGRLLGAGTAATLYGARLGVGPLTILSTWLWWAAALVGASLGAGCSAAVGAAFGAGRVAVMLGASAGAGRVMARRMAAVRRRERVTARGVALAGVVACLLATGTAGG